MPLPLSTDLKFGFICSLPNPAASKATVDLAERHGFDSLWLGDHIEFPVPIMDPLLQIAQGAALSDKLTFGTCVFLLPMRHAVHVAKQVMSLDRLTGGRLIFGTGVGGEFANEWAAVGVPREERGARMSEAIPVLKKIMSGEKVENRDGRFFAFDSLQMKPGCVTPGGPPIWTGGRSKPALERAGKMADGWVSYVVTPQMYAAALEDIARAAEAEKRQIEEFGTGHLLFMRVDDTYEEALDHASDHLSQRYAMDFREAAQKYCALGSPADVAKRISEYQEAGCRHFVLDFTGPAGDRDNQIERFAKEVKPLLNL